MKLEINKLKAVSGYGITKLHDYVKKEDIPAVLEKAEHYSIKSVNTVDKGWCLYYSLVSPDSNPSLSDGDAENDIFEVLKDYFDMDSHSYDYTGFTAEDLYLETFEEIAYK